MKRSTFLLSATTLLAALLTGCSQKDIVAKMTFDTRPSAANQQKRKFREKIDSFVKGVRPASHTDITGGVLQAIEYLNEKDPGVKEILIYR